MVNLKISSIIFLLASLGDKSQNLVSLRVLDSFFILLEI